LQIDKRGEFILGMSNISSKKGIHEDLALVYTFEKIDVIEKDNITIVKKIGCMILSKILSIRL
jgi:hypothetical protein